MAHGVVLHATSALVELVVRESHDVKWIGDLDGVGQHRVEHQPVGARQIQRCVFDVREPRSAARFQPPAGSTALRPWTTSNNFPARTSTIDVEKAWRCRGPIPTNTDLVHGASVTPDLFGHPPSRPVGHHQPGHGDRGNVLGR